MAVQIKPGQRVYIKKLFHEQNYTNAFGSTSRGKKGEYIYSDWIVTFVGKAHIKCLEEVTEDSIIEINSGIFTKEPYQKEGAKVYPKTDKFIVFDFTVFKKSDEKANSTPVANEEIKQPVAPSDDDIPF
jgi:hypothetical protein